MVPFLGLYTCLMTDALFFTYSIKASHAFSLSFDQATVQISDPVISIAVRRANSTFS